MSNKTAMITGAPSGIGRELRRRGEVVPGLLNKFLTISPGLAPSAIALGINRFLLPARR